MQRIEEARVYRTHGTMIISEVPIHITNAGVVPRAMPWLDTGIQKFALSAAKSV
jgi:hypothetical protein